MNTMTYTTARANLAKTIDRVCQNHEPILISKKRESVVMMSLKDYEGWEETVYLLKSPNNAKRLLKSIDSLNKGNTISKSMEELINAES